MRSSKQVNLVFGPVPSRRLGRSLGVNNIPPKICSYSCVYCQLGRTYRKSIKRRTFYSPESLFEEVKRKIELSQKVDYITLVADGEPTLDARIGKEISLFKQLGIPVAVITNASLLWREDVRDDLLEADLISLKIDAVSENLWKSINRPHEMLKLEKVLEGIRSFSEIFKGKIITETMLINVEYKEEIEKIGEFLREIMPERAYIAVPVRPPAEKWVRAAKEDIINKAFQTFSEYLGRNKVELLIGVEEGEFDFTDDLVKEILSITSVHPMREDELRRLIQRANVSWEVIENLLKEKKLIKVEYDGHRYYMRRLTT